MAKKGKTAKARRKPARKAGAAIGIKRVYDEPEKADGLRILIDRLWPRGLAK